MGASKTRQLTGVGDQAGEHKQTVARVDRHVRSIKPRAHRCGYKYPANLFNQFQVVGGLRNVHDTVECIVISEGSKATAGVLKHND